MVEKSSSYLGKHLSCVVYHRIVSLIYLLLWFPVLMQISAKIPFKTDIAFISGTDLESSRVEERVSSLTGSSSIKS